MYPEVEQEIDYAARVAKGAALLDEKWPNWATEIDLESLDLMSSRSCVTAQYDAAARRAAGAEDTRGWYRDGMERLGIECNETYAAHGFDSDSIYDAEGDFVGVAPGAYDALTALWRDLIVQRREAAQPEASER